jgi:hypothetical protein
MTKPFFTEADCDVRENVYHAAYHASTQQSGISVHKANALIRERAKVVYGRVDGDHGWFDSSRGHFAVDADSLVDEGLSTHTALLICVEEIETDSAEQVLKDLSRVCDTKELNDLVGRAKRLLEKK